MKVAAESYPYTFGQSVAGADYLAAGYEPRMEIDPLDITNIATREKQTKDSFEKLRAGDPSAAILVDLVKEEDMMAAFSEPGVWVVADSMPCLATGEEPLTWDSPYGYGSAHPRAAGSHAKVLRFQREGGNITLMEAVAKLSYYQAEWLGPMVPDLQERGRIQQGMIADVTIYDPETVTDKSSCESGKSSFSSTGNPYVIVNGTIVVDDSEVLKVFPGQAIRNDITE
ncbi:MAG: hypothetical protein WBV71_02290 [Roseobacter sp.]